MKQFVLLFLNSLAFSSSFEISGHLDLDAEFYPTRTLQSDPQSYTLKQTLDLEYTDESYVAVARLYAQEAYNDMLNSSEQTDRSFVRVDELYLRFDGEESEFRLGKTINFWGALELRNIVDVFNPNELRDDIFSTNKLGAYNARYSYFTNMSTISFIVKMHEQDLKMARLPYAYYLFGPNISYEKNLQSRENLNRPSFFIKYNTTISAEDYDLDLAFIYENGFDSQRYFTPYLNQPTRYVQNAYLVHKYMTYNTMVVGSTLLKLEALYADVQEDIVVGDYSHLGLGFEHTFLDLNLDGSLGFIGEYYRYETYESAKLDDLQLFESMQNDLFLGLRYALNDVDDSSFVGGVVRDFEYNEEVYYINYKSRFGENMKIDLDYYYVEPSKHIATPYALLGRHQRVGINIAYYF